MFMLNYFLFGVASNGCTLFCHNLLKLFVTQPMLKNKFLFTKNTVVDWVPLKPNLAKTLPGTERRVMGL